MNKKKKPAQGTGCLQTEEADRRKDRKDMGRGLDSFTVKEAEEYLNGIPKLPGRSIP